MRKVFQNQFFILALALSLSLSIFSFMAYKKINKACAMQCCSRQAIEKANGEMIWDAFTRQFSSFVSFQ
jgi:hypothetical protein